MNLTETALGFAEVPTDSSVQIGIIQALIRYAKRHDGAVPDFVVASPEPWRVLMVEFQDMNMDVYQDINYRHTDHVLVAGVKVIQG